MKLLKSACISEPNRTLSYASERDGGNIIPLP